MCGCSTSHAVVLWSRLTLDDEEFPNQHLDIKEAPEHELVPAIDATVSMDEEDLPPAVAAQLRAHEAAAKLFPADVWAQSIALGFEPH